MKALNLNLKTIIFILLASFTFSCETEKDSGSDIDNDNVLLEGYWLLTKGETYAIKDNGEKIVTATLKPGVVAHEFLADGTYIGHDLIGSSPKETGTWKLEVNKKDGKDIEEGILSITTPSTIASAGEVFIDADGSLKFNISSIYSKINNGKSSIYLETKRYEIYPHKENWGYYIYEKQN